MMRCKTLYIFVFFFQAEDGIRDADVTGVQTCALPICMLKASGAKRAMFLNVNAPFHTKMLTGAGQKLREIGRASCRERV